MNRNWATCTSVLWGLSLVLTPSCGEEREQGDSETRPKMELRNPGAGGGARPQRIDRPHSTATPPQEKGSLQEDRKLRVVKVKDCDSAFLARLGNVRWWGWPYRNTMGVLKRKEGDTETVAIVRAYFKEDQLCLENVVTGRPVSTMPSPKLPYGDQCYGECAGYSGAIEWYGRNPVVSPNGHYAALGTTADAYTVMDILEAKPIVSNQRTGSDTIPCGFSEDGKSALVESQYGWTYLCNTEGKGSVVRGRFPQVGATTGSIYTFWHEDKVEREKNPTVIRDRGYSIAARLSPDEKLLAIVCRQSLSSATLRVVEVKGKKWICMSRIEDLQGVRPMVVFSPSTKETVVFGEGRVFIFRTQDGEFLTRLVTPATVELVGFLEDGGQTQLALVNEKEVWVYRFSEIVGESKGRPTDLTPELRQVWTLMSPGLTGAADQVRTALQLAATKDDENAALEGALWLAESDAVTDGVVPKVLDLLEAAPPYTLEHTLVEAVQRFPRAPRPEDHAACGTEKGLRRILVQFREEDRPAFLASLLKTGDAARRRSVAELLEACPACLGWSARRKFEETASEDRDLRVKCLDDEGALVRLVGLRATIKAFDAKYWQGGREMAEADLVELGNALSIGMGEALVKARSESAERFERYATVASKDGAWARPCIQGANELLKRECEAVRTEPSYVDRIAALRRMGQAIAGLAAWQALNDRDHKPIIEFLMGLLGNEDDPVRAATFEAIGMCHGRLAVTRDAILGQGLRQLKAYAQGADNWGTARAALEALGKLDDPPATLPNEVLAAFEGMQAKGPRFVAVFEQFPPSWGKAYPQRTLKLLIAELERERESDRYSSYSRSQALKQMFPEVGVELEKYRDSKVESIRKLVEELLGR